ncbi:MAG: sulfatase, partial [Opitutales bacterium]
MNPIKQLKPVLFVCLATWSVHGESLPNMVFLMTDDQGWGDVGYNGHPKIKTPHLDDMAKSGLRFDRFYAGASVCSPTRATCMTGRSNWRVSINDPSRADEEHLPQEEITLPEALKEKGY